MEKLRLLPKTRADVPVFWGAVKDHEIQEMLPFERETLEDALGTSKNRYFDIAQYEKPPFFIAFDTAIDI